MLGTHTAVNARHSLCGSEKCRTGRRAAREVEGARYGYNWHSGSESMYISVVVTGAQYMPKHIHML